MFPAGAINEAANDVTVYCAIIEYRNSLLLLLLNIIALYSFMVRTQLKYCLARFMVLSSFLFALHSLNIALVANSTDPRPLNGFTPTRNEVFISFNPLFTSFI